MERKNEKNQDIEEKVQKKKQSDDDDDELETPSTLSEKGKKKVKGVAFVVQKKTTATATLEEKKALSRFLSLVVVFSFSEAFLFTLI